MMFLLVAIVAHGAEPPPSGDIVQIPEGSTITLPGKPTFTVKSFSFLLPEPMYDQALIKAKQLAICEPALDRCSAMALGWVDVSGKALAACSGQFDTDETAIKELTAQVSSVENRALAAESKLVDVRHQRNIAWAITGSLVLGAVATTAVAIGG